MPRSLNRFLDVGTFACAFVLTALLVRREMTSRSPRAPFGQDRQVPDWVEVKSVGHRIGPDSAPVTIVEFSDFQCPYCARFARQLLPAVLRRPDRAITVVFRHWPLSIHPFATDAAVAAECAGAQQRFEAFHDALFANQDSIGVWSFDRFAELAGIPNLPRFSQCRSGQEARAVVERDRKAAMALDARGTPTFIVNGVMLSGALDAARIDSIVRATDRSRNH
jgi:protein-disulfide isomerase